MYNLIAADLYKIRKSAAIKVLFAITAASAVAMAIIAYLLSQGKIAQSMASIGFMFSDADVISIIGAVIAGVFICGDYDNKAIHDAVAGGCSRMSVVTSKIITFCCAGAFILLPYAIATGIALGTGCKFSMGSVGVGFMNLMSAECGKAFSAAEILKLLACMLTLIIVYLGQLSICVPLAVALKKPVLVVAVYYGLTILNASLGGLRSSSKTFDNILALTPYGGKYNFVTLATGAGDFFKAIAVSLLFIVIMLAVTYGVFRKSEIK